MATVTAECLSVEPLGGISTRIVLGYILVSDKQNKNSVDRLLSLDRIQLVTAYLCFSSVSYFI